MSCTIENLRLLRLAQESSEWHVTKTGDPDDIDGVTGIEYIDEEGYQCYGCQQWFTNRTKALEHIDNQQDSAMEGLKRPCTRDDVRIGSQIYAYCAVTASGEANIEALDVADALEAVPMSEKLYYWCRHCDQEWHDWAKCREARVRHADIPTFRHLTPLPPWGDYFQQRITPISSRSWSLHPAYTG
jgi:hypothetical protein